MVGVNITLQLSVPTVATYLHQFWVWSSLPIFNAVSITAGCTDEPAGNLNGHAYMELQNVHACALAV